MILISQITTHGGCRGCQTTLFHSNNNDFIDTKYLKCRRKQQLTRKEFKQFFSLTFFQIHSEFPCAPHFSFLFFWRLFILKYKFYFYCFASTHCESRVEFYTDCMYVHNKRVSSCL